MRREIWNGYCVAEIHELVDLHQSVSEDGMIGVRGVPCARGQSMRCSFPMARSQLTTCSQTLAYLLERSFEAPAANLRFMGLRLRSGLNGPNHGSIGSSSSRALLPDGRTTLATHNAS